MTIWSSCYHQSLSRFISGGCYNLNLSAVSLERSLTQGFVLRDLIIFYKLYHIYRRGSLSSSLQVTLQIPINIKTTFADSPFETFHHLLPRQSLEWLNVELRSRFEVFLHDSHCDTKCTTLV